MDINTVNNGVAKRKGRKRLGRGTGSGTGKTAGRGSNGQGARAGFSMSPVFEGGQMPLVRRIPKRGFNNKAFADVVESVSLKSIAACFDGSEVIGPEALLKRGLISRADSYVKVIGNDELDKSLKFKVHAASKGATAAVEKAGGSFEFLPKKKPVVKNKMKPRVKK
ncbi:MAG: 50S ribosomal protein L15 [Planctomycetia bacterium]|nr:50S ribosomal protein L15 [Planctomycetia bacterium]